MKDSDGNDRPAARRLASWWTPAFALLAAVLLLWAIGSGRFIESYLVMPAGALVIAGAALTLGIWFLRATRSRRRARTVGFGLAVLALTALAFSVRVSGTVSGSGVPRLVWRWHSSRELGAPAVVAGDAVDLLHTTANDFPEFLGAGRSNAILGVHLSRDWSQPPRRLWRQPIGVGWSGFAVVGNYAVTQEQRGPKEMIVCYELLTGRARWEHENDARFSEWQGGDGPRATPTISGGRVYAMGATGILDCLDGSNGKLIWSRDVLRDGHASNLTYGKSCSPLVVDDLVVVTGGQSGPSLLAYKKDSGEPAWQGGTESPGYASPVVATVAGVRQILTINSQSAEGHDVADGRVLWRFDWPGQWPKDTQPIALPGDRVLLSAGYSVGSVMLHIESSGSGLTAVPLWTSRKLRPKFANSAIRGNYVYGMDDVVLTCLDLSDGKRVWREGDYGHGQILLVDDLLVVQAESGEVALVEASPAGFHELGRFAALDGKTWTGPALSGHYLVVRNDHEAACYELP